MKKLTVREQYDYFKDVFSHCGCFLLELSDEDLLYYLFEEFDVDATSVLHMATLEPLRENGYIDDEIVSMCQSLREMYFKFDQNTMWTAEEIRSSMDWLNLFCLADEIRMRLLENIN